MPPIDVTAVRATTPGCHDRIHLNAAGSALPSTTVLDTQLEHLRLEATIGGYEAAAVAADRVAAVRPTIAHLIGARPEGTEVALTVNSTAAFDLFLYSWATSPAHALRAGDRILTTVTEYGANMVAYLQLAARTGAEVEVVASTPTGEIDLDALDRTIRRTDAGPARLVALNHMPTNGGLINPAAEVGAIARRHGVTFLLDACQAAGQLPLDVTELGCHALAATGRKYLRGPRGTGFLWVDPELLPTIEPVMLDHDAAHWTEPFRYEIDPTARRFEQWEKNHAALLGLGQAVHEANELGVAAIAERVQTLADDLRSRLVEQVPGCTVHDLGRRRSGIVTFSVAGHHGPDLKASLAERHMHVTSVTRDSALMDTIARDLPSMVRASVHVYNTEAELDAFTATVAELADA